MHVSQLNGSQIIADARSRFGWTQEYLGKLLGISDSTISAYESGRSSVPLTVSLAVLYLVDLAEDLPREEVRAFNGKKKGRLAGDRKVRRDREIFNRLKKGETVDAVAERFSMSPAHVSRVRDQYVAAGGREAAKA